MPDDPVWYCGRKTSSRLPQTQLGEATPETVRAKAGPWTEEDNVA